MTYRYQTKEPRYHSISTRAIDVKDGSVIRVKGTLYRVIEVVKNWSADKNKDAIEITVQNMASKRTELFKRGADTLIEVRSR